MSENSKQFIPESAERQTNSDDLLSEGKQIWANVCNNEKIPVAAAQACELQVWTNGGLTKAEHKASPTATCADKQNTERICKPIPQDLVQEPHPPAYQDTVVGGAAIQTMWLENKSTERDAHN